ncbi:MAG: SWIM zinc finger family protein [Ilumatobacteraceae bacterium]
MAVRPTHDQVLSLAPDPAAATAALPGSVPGVWSGAGCDDGAVWGQYIATSSEPYNVAVDLSDDVSGPAYRCNCPSRKIPCKHVLGLLLLLANGGVAPARRLPFAAEWLQRRVATVSASVDQPTIAEPVPTHDGGATTDAGSGALGGGARSPRDDLGVIDPARQKRQLERSERMRAGLQELDRWLADRIRVGLASAELSDPTTWERLAARLVDAQCGALANRVKRIATKVGQHARWHEDVLEEMALMHALAVGAQRTSGLPVDLADGVHVATGLTVAKDDVLASVPSTARWIVAGESRTREDKITVQRTWLASGPPQGPATWAMILAFGAFGNEVTTEHQVGRAFEADIHWYPGGINLRALVGRLHSEPGASASPPPVTTIAAAMQAAGWALAGEPWLERYPLCIVATPAPLGNGRWVLADDTGSVPIVSGFSRTAEIVAVSGGSPITLVGEWSAEGVLPLTLFAAGQAVPL